MKTNSILVVVRRVIILAAWGGLLFSASGALVPGKDELLAKYEAIRHELVLNDFNAPVLVESEAATNTMRGDVYGLIDADFKAVRTALSSASGWCDLACLHMNVKAAVHIISDNRSEQVVVYVGRKRYQRPERSSAIIYQFSVEQNGDDFLSVVLSSDDGPHGTRNHRLSCTAIPVGNGRAFMKMSYSCDYGLLAKAYMTTYLNTLGRRRVGFTVTSQDNSGGPVYIKGVRGVVERNSMRYYIAVNAYLAARDMPDKKGFEYRLNYWYDYTMLYPRQLDDLEKDEYLDYKRRERTERERLQAEAVSP